MGRPYGPKDWIPHEQSDAPCFAAERRDLATPRAIEAALQASEERYRYTIALSPLIPWIADAGGQMTDIDIRGLESTGASDTDCLGTGFLSLVHPSDRPMLMAAWRQAKATGRPLDYEVRLRLRDGMYHWHRSRGAPRLGRGGSIVCWYGTIENIDDRKRADEAIRWSADHDDLTSLWNRRAFMRGLRTALAGADGADVDIALLLIDLDQFKALNDRYGHDAGDALLKEVSRRLEQVGAGDTMVGRLGGDEFALLLYTSDLSCLEITVAELRRALCAPYSLNDQAHICRASIGVAIYPGHGDQADTLYKNADLALYEAKGFGDGTRFFQSGMRAGLQTRLSQLSMARHALDHDHIIPFYQPKIDLRSGRVTGFEALLRWRQGTRGVQPPAVIAAAFEDAELALALGERMFERVVADIAQWQRLRLPFGRVAINVSAVEFRCEDFADRLLARVERSGIPASSLELEVTETVLLERALGNVADIFGKLRSIGMTIALDDFGTGYASLIHLKQFPVDVLKIDCSFVQALSDRTNAAIVRAIIGLGKSLGITTVAEGVESTAQALLLHQEGCDLAQGYLFSPAMTAERVPDVLERVQIDWNPGDRRSGRDRRK